jgi:ATP-dependent DNA ligase
MNGFIELKQDTKTWQATVVDNTVVYSWCKISGGVWQRQENVHQNGKNIGKANETTAHQQAVVEAKSKVNKKIVEGYTVVTATGCLDNLELKSALKSPLPMLAANWGDQCSKALGHKVFIQPKLDGIRCIANAHTGELFSRKGEPILSTPHVTEAILALKIPKEIVWLDGELFNPDLVLQEITAIVRTQKKLHPNYNLIDYHVYDCVDFGCKLPFEMRSAKLCNILSMDDNAAVKRVPTICFKQLSVEDCDDETTRLIDLGFEGAIVRLAHSKYEIDKRSNSLLKVKRFMQEEFPIVSLNKEKHKETLGTFTLRLPNGNTFDSTPKMPDESKQQIWDERNITDWTDYVATVKFHGYSKDGVPKINVTLATRHKSDC